MSYDKKYDKAIKLALANTVIVDNIDNAIALSKKIRNSLRIVTISGELIAQTGSITGGKSASRSGGVIGRKEKILELGNIVTKKELELDKVKSQIVELEKQKNCIKEELDKVLPQKEALVIDIATLTEKRENLKRNRKNRISKEII